MSEWRPAPRAQSLLLEPGMMFTGQRGKKHSAVGTGICGPIVGSARSAKTSLALTLMEWASKRAPDRDLAFIGVPDCFIDALPEAMQEKASNPKLSCLSTLRDSIVLLDDAAVNLNSRDSSTTTNRVLSRLAGVISHLGLTVIVCTQSLAGVDLSLMRYTEMCPLIRRVDPMSLRAERGGWVNEVEDAQRTLKGVGFDRSFYVSLADDGLLCKAPFPDWIRDEDVLSRPYRHLPQKELDALMRGGGGK